MKSNDENNMSIIEMDWDGNIVHFDEEAFNELPDCHILKSLGKFIKRYQALEQENNTLMEINLKHLEKLQRLN